METSNRINHRPIPVTEGDLEGVKWCPCCKVGVIEREDGAPMAECSKCGQRYQLKSVEGDK